MPAVTGDWLGLGPSDTAILYLGYPNSGTAVQATAALFNGDTLLGSNSSNYGEIYGQDFAFFWTNTGSSFTRPEATFIDASSLIGRSIQGRIVVTFDGTYSFDTYGFSVGYGIYTFMATAVGDEPILTGMSVIAVPEPETYAMMLAGLGLVGFMVRHRKLAKV